MKFASYKTSAIIIVLIGALIRIILALHNFPAGDSTWHLNVARFIAETNTIPSFESLGREMFSYPPVFYLLCVFFYKIFIIFGPSFAETSMKLVSPLFGSLSLGVTFLLAKELYDEKIGFYATLFVTFLPIHIFLSSIAHLDMTFSFFILVSVYFAIRKEFFWSALSIGLANNVRFYGILIFPVFAYILFKSLLTKSFFDKIFLKKLFFYGFIVFLLSVPWFIRNYEVIGNPVYPAFNTFFHAQNSYVAEQYTSSIFNIFDAKYFTRIPLEIVGVPNGEMQNLFSINFPYRNFLLFVWFFGCLVFFVPLLFYKLDHDIFKKNLFFLWSGMFIFFMIAIAYEVNTYARHFLPAIPIIACMWGIGVSNLFLRLQKYSNSTFLKKLVVVLFICIIVGFVFVEGVKNVVATKQWERYDTDYDWVKGHTPTDALFYWDAQGLSFLIDRPTAPLTNITSAKKGYFWVQEEKDARGRVSSMIRSLPVSHEQVSLVYENNMTRTKIYKLK